MQGILSLALAAILSLQVVPAQSQTTYQAPVIHVYSDTISTYDLAVAIAAIQVQIDCDLFPAWGYRARLSLADGPDEYQFFLTNNLESKPLQKTCHCWGIHGVVSGVPTGYLFLYATNEKDHFIPWSIVMSHEILEMIVDPMGDQKTMISGRGVLLEVGDAVHRHSYSIGNVLVQDFVLPGYYIEGNLGPWDFLHELLGPYPETDDPK